jgi:predicted NAD-dependent protein-ADP-ribosyltransferase YbiA (DUF1768 family)
MSDEPTRAPTSADSAMPANAASRGRHGKRQDRASREQQQGMVGNDADTHSFGQLGHSIRRAFDRSAEQVGDDVGMTPEIRASKERSAELLRDASDLVAERTNDS